MSKEKEILKRGFFIVLLLAATVLCFLAFPATAQADTYVLTQNGEEETGEDEEALAITGGERMIAMPEDPDLVIPASFAAPRLASAPALRDSTPIAQGDGMSIEWLTLRWTNSDSAGTNDGDDSVLSLIPDADEVIDHQWQINFYIKGEVSHAPGTVNVEIPAYIWLDREGKETAKLALFCPEAGANTGKAFFAYKRVGDKILITNVRRIDNDSNIMMQGSFTRLRTLDAREVNIDPASRYYQAPDLGYSQNLDGLDGYSMDFWAKVSLTTPNTDTPLTAEAGPINANINTQIKMSAATKSSSNNYVYYNNLPTDGIVERYVPKEMRDVLTDQNKNINDYVFVRWYVTGTAVGWQPFTMKLTDANNKTLITAKNDTTTEYGNGVVLGVTGLDTFDFYETKNEHVIQNSSTVAASADDGSVTAVLYDGHTTAPRSAYVWAAYPKSSLSSDEYRDLYNTVTVSVRGQDDLEIDSVQASGKVSVKIPTTYSVKKVWKYVDGENNEIAKPAFVEEPTRVGIHVNGGNLNNKSFTLSEDNLWTASWSDEGKDYTPATYTITEDSYSLDGKTVNNAVHKKPVTDQKIDGVDCTVWYWYEESAPVYDAATKTWTITNTYHQEIIPYTHYTVQKIWKNATTGFSTADPNKTLADVIPQAVPESYSPSSVTANIRYQTASGSAYHSLKSFTLDAEHNWKGEWTDKGDGYIYSATENTVYPTESGKSYYTDTRDGQKYHVVFWYTTEISDASVNETNHTGLITITNIYHEQLTPYYTYTVNKVWDDGSYGASDRRPASATVYVSSSSGNSPLTRWSGHKASNTVGNGVNTTATSFSWEAYGMESSPASNSFTVSEYATAWSYTTYVQNGHQYRVAYRYVPTVLFDAATRTWTVTNTYEQKEAVAYTGHAFRKVWLNDDDHLDRRPNTTNYTVTVKDGNTTVRTDYYSVTVSDDGSKYTVKKGGTELGIYDMPADGVPVFTVEDEGYGYTYQVYESSVSNSVTWEENSVTYRQQYWYTPVYGSETYDAATFTYVRTITNRYTEGQAIAYTKHGVTKAWDFSAVGGRENAAWVPDSTHFSIYRNNSSYSSGSFDLSDTNNTYLWTDEGWGYSYSVSETAPVDSAHGGRTYYNGTNYAGSYLVWIDSDGNILAKYETSPDFSRENTDARLARVYYGYTPVYGGEVWNEELGAYIRTVTNKYFERIVPHQYYTLTKVWNDNLNAAGHRAESQLVTIVTRDSSGRTVNTRTVDVGVLGELIHQWNTEGSLGYQYAVYEYNANRDGYTEWEEIEGGEFRQVGDTEKTPAKKAVHWIYSPGTITSATTTTAGGTSTTAYTVVNNYQEVESRMWATPLEPDRLAVNNSKTAADHQNRYEVDSDRDINAIRGGRDVLLGYRVSGNANLLQYTQAETQTRADYVSYGARQATVRLEDQPTFIYNYNNANTQYALSAADYEFATVTLHDAAVKEWYQENIPGSETVDVFSDWKRRDATVIPEISLYGEDRDGVVQRYAVRDGNFGLPTPENGAILDGGAVKLPSGIVRVWTEMKTAENSKQYSISMSYDVTLRLLPSDGMLNLIQETFTQSGDGYATMRVTNRSRTLALGTKDGESMTATREADSWIHGFDLRTAAGIDSKFKYDVIEDSDKNNEIETLHITDYFYQQTNEKDRTKYNNELAEDSLYQANSGIWYDLVPAGFEPDMDSVTVSGGGEIRWKQAIPNYKGTGETLVVVSVSYPEELRYASNYGLTGYCSQHSLSFDIKSTWDTIIAYKLYRTWQFHTAVFEADNAVIGDVPNYCGEPDTPYGEQNVFSKTLTNGVSSSDANDTAYEKDAAALTELDSGRDDNAFVYHRQKVWFLPNLGTTLTLQKLVSADNINWVKGHTDTATPEEDDPLAQKVSVYENSPYTYRITVVRSANGYARGIVIYDFLEQTELLTDDTRWYGTLESIDLTEIEKLGCAPVVYYSTETGMGQYSVENKEPPALNSDTWSTSLPEGGLSAVTAIAVDCSKRPDGSEFWLGQNEEEGGGKIDVLELYVHMRAPMYNQVNATELNPNPKAYNSASYRFIDDSDNEVYETAQYYTQIEIEPYDVTVEKKWDDDDDRDGIRPTGVTVYLLQKTREMEDFAYVMTEGETPQKMSVTLNDINHWKGSFENLRIFDDEGFRIEYRCEEVPIAGEEDRFEQYSSTVTTVSEDGKLTFTMTNTHEPEMIEIPVLKSWEGEDGYTADRPSSIRAKLYRYDVENAGQSSETQTRVYTGRQLNIRPEPDGSWSGVFKNVYKYRDHGQLITYEVEEEAVDCYRPAYGTVEIDDPNGDAGDKIQALSIVNNYYPYGDLQVSKQVRGATPAASGREFTFSLVLTDPSGEYIQDRFNYVRYNAEGTPIESTLDIAGVLEGNGIQIGNGSEFKLKDGEYIVIKDIPVRSTYAVTEQHLGGFSLYSTSNKTGSIRSSRAQEAKFINQYNAEGSAPVSVTKELLGRMMQQGQFRFQLLEGLETPAGGEDRILRYASNDEADPETGRAPVYFSPLHYSLDELKVVDPDNPDDPNPAYAESKTYYYRIAEMIPDNPPAYYTYDGKTVYVKVTVSDRDGSGVLKAEVSYHSDSTCTDENKLTAPLFSNEYRAQGSLTPQAGKVLKYGTLTEEQFSFQIQPLQENPGSTPQTWSFASGSSPETKKNDAAGNIVFSPLSFTLNKENLIDGKTFWYAVREVIPTGNTDIVYDERVLGFAITVRDNGDGTLSFDQETYEMLETITESGSLFRLKMQTDDSSGTPVETNIPVTTVPEFQNKLAPGKLTVTKYISDATAPNNELLFPFKLLLTGEDVPLTEQDGLVISITNGENVPDYTPGS